jgi:hypothetical protein
MYRQRRASLEKVNGVETVIEIPAADVALSELHAAPAESLSSVAGGAAEMAAVPSARLVPRRLRPQTAAHRHP